MTDPNAPRANDTDPATPQDQFKPGESHYGQDEGSSGTSTVTPITANDGHQGSDQPDGAARTPGTAMTDAESTGNDQAQPGGGGLGQNQQGYGQSPDLEPQAGGEADVTGHAAEQQSSQGIGARPGTLGPSPTGGAGQPASATTGGPDLSKGLSDNNRGGGI